MRQEVFFRNVVDNDNVLSLTKRVLNDDLLNEFRDGNYHDYGEVEVAGGLVKLLHNQYAGYGTSGAEIDNEESIKLLKVTRMVVQRVGLDFPDVPFRDFEGFYRYWKREGMTNSWAARRDYIAELFSHLEEQLEHLEDQEYTDNLASPISPKGALGWPAIDREIAQLRKRFLVATTPQDFSAVGTACVRILEGLSRVAYDPSRHLRDGETEPPVDKTKQRLSRVAEDALTGHDNAKMRKLFDGTIEVAHSVKHSTTPTRKEAGIASDATILLANIIRRLSDE